jgi:chitin disaccharide deacetylase
MKKIVSILIFISIITAQAQQPIRLIVRGDDMGYTHSGNIALIKAYKEGIQKTVEVIVPSPWFPEAVKLLKENPGLDVGIHLAITSEWENIKWRPVSNCKSLTDSNGYFYPMVWPNKNYPGQSITENKWNIADVEKEFRAQIELALKNIASVSHISAHMLCTHISAEVKALAKRLAKEYNIDIEPEDYGAQYVQYAGPSKTKAEKIESFIAMLNKLQPGNTYWFLDHPGIADAELQAVYHIGYENVADDRQGVTELFTSEKVKAVIRQRGIQLISYADLKKGKE